jgi:hypothetical protein
MDFVGGTRFNAPLVTSLTAVNPQFPNLLAGAQAAGAAGAVLPDPAIRNPYAQHFNLTVERQLWAPQAVLSTAYVGTASVGNARVALPNGGIALGPSQRPDPTFGMVNRLETSAFSSYHSLQTSLSWRQRDLTLLVSYTFSKLIDDVSDYSTSASYITRELISLDERNRRLDRSVSDMSIPHVFKLAYSYSLPMLRGNRFLGGWQAQGITTAMSGRPYTLYSGGLNLFGSVNNRILDLPGSLIRSPAAERVAIALAPGVTTTQLSPAFGRLGTIGRNTERGDRLLQFDFSVFKTFGITERLHLQFRAEAYNLFNTVNYAVPDNTLSSPNFGQALSAGIARQAQLALRVSF